MPKQLLSFPSLSDLHENEGNSSLKIPFSLYLCPDTKTQAVLNMYVTCNLLGCGAGFCFGFS